MCHAGIQGIHRRFALVCWENTDVLFLCNQLTLQTYDGICLMVSNGFKVHNPNIYKTQKPFVHIFVKHADRIVVLICF